MPFTIERTLRVDAPASVVWEVLTDLPRYGEWNPFCIEVSSTLKPGDPIDMRVKLMAKPQFQREFMTAYQAGSGFAYSMKPAPLGALSSGRSHRIESIDATHCRYESKFMLQGWLMPLVRGLMGQRLLIGFTGMNDGVKRRAESLWQSRQAAA